jgi:folylpolyglutamate synthase/dihydropteroate synthase
MMGFEKLGSDIVVIEAGMGGRSDATNVYPMTPLSYPL